jgi:mevalonate kinase
MESVTRYYSNGKLMITGEYLVLHGALSLAVPTAAGQYLYVHAGGEDDLLRWKANVKSTPWFECIIRPDTWDVIRSDREEIAERLVKLLKAASDLKGQTGWLRGVTAVSEIGFDIEWGLGSSSSLISNLAWWADVDPYSLFSHVSRGSGYDIACARSEYPILYKTDTGGREISEIPFYPEFSGQLAFVYLGRKQDSNESVWKFLDHALVREADIDKVSELSKQAAESKTLQQYNDLLQEHEGILSGILDRPPVKEALFRDYPGMVKSLGAWGGDFVHISMEAGLEAARDYFSGKGLGVLIPFDEMIKPPPHET